MSHYSVKGTQFADQGLLCAALGDLGYKVLSVSDKAQSLYGYHGDVRPEKAEIVIRRGQIGSASNDIGFALQSDGTYSAIISDYDSLRHDAHWLDRLKQRYAYHATVTELRLQGYAVVSEKVGELGAIEFELERVAE